MYVSGIIVITVLCICGVCAKYDPNWASLDARPLPVWYDDAKLGIFIHWGIYSVPSYTSEWFWNYWKVKHNKDIITYMNTYYRPRFTYEDFATDFHAAFFDPNEWADLFKDSGAEYIVITSKHHDGYSMWPSKYSVGWNSMALGPRRDIIGELGTAIKNKTSLHYGIYYSLSEWFNPLFLDDKANNFTTQEYVNTKTLPQLYELVKSYKPDVLWVDVLDKALGSYWKAQEFLAWLYNDSPVKDSVVTNDRWGYDTWCHHGGVMTCHDRFLPDQLQKKKWENAMTIDKGSFGFRRNAKLSSFLSSQDLINTFVQTVSFGGNMLMNVGPTEEGTIHPIYEERLRDIGNWLSVNNEAIKSSRPWTTQNDKLSPNVWYTKKQNVVYAIILGFKSGVTLSLTAPKSDHDTHVHILGYNGPQLTWLPRLDGGMDITIPAIPYNKIPSNFAVTLKLTGLANHSGSHIIGK
ncbi:hypothetical protein SNE40_014489 [Patella caerulea]|uniref:alpha-L-fucosidase n=1 Tax=Patella caerulea TaxID=87958 RepID=A0AAN8JIE6_PATCE